MKRKIFYFLSAFTIISCGKKAPEDTFIDFKPNENVISFKINYDISDSEIAKRGPVGVDTFNMKTDTVKYIGDEIYISYLDGVTGCVVYDGDIKIENDTLTLKLVPINNMACTEILFARLTYKIKNPKKIKYVIRKQ
jgi:hypothetical protein